MFRSKRGDTLASTIEQAYRIELNIRGDTKLSNLLADRGFDSVSQLVTAYHGRAKNFARRRRLFISFDADDKAQVGGFRLMRSNPNIDLDYYETSLKVPVNSENGSYIKQVIRQKIAHASVLLCLVGNATAWSGWVDWEIRAARALRKGLCGVRLKGSRGRVPPALVDVDAPVARWNMQEIIAAIECAAARRS